LMVASWDLKCAGRLDRVFQWSDGKTIAVVEIKTGKPSPQHGVQLAGQAILFAASCPPGAYKPKNIARWAVYLHNDGEFIRHRDLVEYKDRGDYATFMACLALTHWRKKNHSKRGESTW
jgi:hypothetical protein